MNRKQTSSNSINSNVESAILTANGGRIPYYFLNIFIFVAVLFLSTRLKENPTLVGILMGILILMFLPSNEVDYFSAYQDHLVVLYKKVFFLQFLNKKMEFKYDEIHKVTVTLKVDRKIAISTFIFNFFSKLKVMPSNTLEIEMKIGKKKVIGTDTYNEQLLPILKFMKSKGVDIQIVYPDNKDI